MKCEKIGKPEYVITLTEEEAQEYHRIIGRHSAVTLGRNATIPNVTSVSAPFKMWNALDRVIATKQ